MTNNPLIPQSKLPQLGTTIFTQMSALADAITEALYKGTKRNIVSEDDPKNAAVG